MGILSNILGSKKEKDLTRTELEQLASEYKIEFTKETTDAELKASLEFVIKETTSTKTKKIKFLLSPTGKFNLAYNAGETAELLEEQANALIEAKYAEEVK